MDELKSQAMCVGAVLAIGEMAQATYDSLGKKNLYGQFGKMLMVNPVSVFPRLVSRTRDYIALLENGRGKSPWAEAHNGGRGKGIYLSKLLNTILVSDEMVSNPLPNRFLAREQTEMFLGHALMTHNLYSSNTVDDEDTEAEDTEVKE